MPYQYLKTKFPKIILCDDFFWYINERWKMREKRVKGLPPPWTTDRILRDWSFTNVFRQLDRGTIELWKHLNKHYNNNDADLLFNIIVAREFNFPSTFQELGYFSKDRPWTPKTVKAQLHEISDRPQKVFTSAHLVRSEHAISKIDSVVDLLVPFWRDRERLYGEFKDHASIEWAYDRLKEYRLIGDFMSYQFILDMMDTPILRDVEDSYTWACVGPGAWKGLLWMYPEMKKPEALGMMMDLWDMSPKFLPRSILQHPKYPWTVHEIEFCLCEFGKYCKIKYLGKWARNHYHEVDRPLPDAEVYTHGIGIDL